MLDDSANYPQAELAERLRAAIEAAGITQAYLAERCGVTKQAVTGWLTTGRISKVNLHAVAEITHVPLEFFLEPERGQSKKTRTIWERIGTLVTKAMVMFVLAIPPLLPDPAEAIEHKSFCARDLTKLCIACIRRLRELLRRVLDPTYLLIHI